MALHLASGSEPYKFESFSALIVASFVLFYFSQRLGFGLRWRIARGKSPQANVYSARSDWPQI